MEAAIAGSELRIYEAIALGFPVCLRLPSPTEWGIYDPETDVSGLLGVWTGSRVFLGANAFPAV
jgi:hypothetical protein